MFIAAAAAWGDPTGSNSATESLRFLRRSLHDYRSLREARGRELYDHQMLER
jgi:ribosomal protein S21